jgi:hypothetical protein
MRNEIRDIFICHASEDKAEIVRPIVEALKQSDITYWFDEAEIKWGDSITRKINEGLMISKYIIVILSPAFIGKNWPERELNAVLNIEVSKGEVKVLPLLVGSKKEQDDIISRYPLINDKRYLPWDGNINNIVNALLLRLGNKTLHDKIGKNIQPIGIKIPMPKIKKKYTQQDKDLFLKDAFNKIKQYFIVALSELKNNYKDLDTDFSEIHNFKFICTIYLKGEISNRCKIWLGGMYGSNAIQYHEGRMIGDVDSDNSLSDSLSVEDNGEYLGFKALMLLYSQQYSEKNLMSVQAAAEHLWRRFIYVLK